MGWRGGCAQGEDRTVGPSDQPTAVRYTRTKCRVGVTSLHIGISQCFRDSLSSQLYNRVVQYFQCDDFTDYEKWMTTVIRHISTSVILII